MLNKLLVLICLLLFINACSHKRIETLLQKGNLIAYTLGDYELTKAVEELSKTLSIPIHKEKTAISKSTSLEEITLSEIDGALSLIIHKNIFQKCEVNPVDNALYIVHAIANVIKKYPHIIIQVTGHIDSHEKIKCHQDLSDYRAISIAGILYDFNLKNEIYAKGCADKKPLITHKNNINSLSNAQIEIYLYGNKTKMVDHCN